MIQWLPNPMLESPGQSFRNTHSQATEQTKHKLSAALGPWELRFFSPEKVYSQRHTMIPGEHLETGISVHQLIIKVSFFQLRLFQPVNTLRGKAFRDFLYQYKGKSIM